VDRGDNIDLVVVRQALDEAAKRLAGLGEGQDDPDLKAARDLVDVSILAATRALGGLSAWTLTWLDALLLVVIAWVAATACDLVGLPGGWTIAVTVLVALGSVWPILWLQRALRDLANRRRLRPSPPPPAWSLADLAPAEQVLHVLAAARSALAVTMRRRVAAHRFGHAARTAAGFDWVRQNDTGLYFATLADRTVCQAIEYVEYWLTSVERER
jgi:hypothetical protein